MRLRTSLQYIQSHAFPVRQNPTPPTPVQNSFFSARGNRVYSFKYITEDLLDNGTRIVRKSTGLNTPSSEHCSSVLYSALIPNISMRRPIISFQHPGPSITLRCYYACILSGLCSGPHYMMHDPKEPSPY